MKIAVVIVTFNRLKCLQKALSLYSAQTLQPQYIIVVDNHSTDGTSEYLERWQKESSFPHRVVLSLSQNEGGAGGFYVGMQYALKCECDWIWVADDDAYPNTNVFEKLDVIGQKIEKRDVCCLCSAVYENGAVAIEHRKVANCIHHWEGEAVPIDEYKKSYFEVDRVSFVGAMVRKEQLANIGLPRRDFFIYFDDTEFSMRLKKVGRIVCIPEAIVNHASGKKGDENTLSWREYYNTRNLLYIERLYYGSYAFWGRALRRVAAAVWTGNWERVKMYWCAVRDAHNQILGISAIYPPGWKSK